MNQCIRRTLFTNGGRMFHIEKVRKSILVNRVEVRKFVGQNINSKESKRSWFSLRSVITRWTPLGVAVYLGWLWEKGINENTTDIEIACYKYLPLRTVSKLWGKIANIELPMSYRTFVYGKYSSLFNVNLDEAITDDFLQYDSLGMFFARSLKAGARHVESTGCLVVPCDGKVLSCGPVTSNRVEQVKGVTYSLESFFGEKTWDLDQNGNKKTIHGPLERTESEYEKQSHKLGNLKKYSQAVMEGYENENLQVVSNKSSETRNSYYGSILENSNLGNVPNDVSQTNNLEDNPKSDYYNSILEHPEKNILHECVIYLAPGDYHRFHAPCDWSAKFRRHFSGKLLSVNPIIAKLIPGLFCVNERAVYVGDWKYGFFSYTAVGATNVGSIEVYKDKTLHTNGRKQKHCSEKVLGFDFQMKRGEMVGQFNMGSTIVLIFEAPSDFRFSFKDGDRVKMGQILGTIGKSG